MPVKPSGFLKQSEITAEFGGNPMSVHQGQTWYTPGTAYSTYETFGPGLTNWSVPLYAGDMTWEIVSGGGGGGSGGNSQDSNLGHDGYPGYKLTGIFNPAPGSVVKVVVGSGGGYGPNWATGSANGGYDPEHPSGVGGAGGASANGFNGGNGANGLGAGGGGGGASVLYNASNTVIAVAGGGGGGGGARWGFGAFAPGRDQQAFVASGNNAGGASGLPIDAAGGGGGGGGGYQGAAGGAVVYSGLGGYSGGTGTNLVPGGWSVVSAANQGLGTNRTIGTDGGNGYVKVTYTAQPLTVGTFPLTNLNFSKFYNKQINDPAGAGSISYTSAGNYSFVVPLHRNTVTIDCWAAGGGSASGSGGDSSVSWSTGSLSTTGGYSGGGGGRRYIGPGGSGGGASGGDINEGGGAGVAAGPGGAAGGGGYGGGAGGSGPTQTYGTYYGGAGGQPGGGVGGVYARDTSPSPGFSGQGGGGGGGFARAQNRAIATGDTIYVTIGGPSSNGVSASGTGKVTISWS